MRQQYIALAVVFLMMMTFNLTATYRAGRIAAGVARLDEQRMRADAVVHEFNRITKEINQLRERAGLIEQIDTKIDIAAILAEISHVVGKSIVLSRIDLVAEPFAASNSQGPQRGPLVRAAARASEPQREMPLGPARLRIVLAGVAAHPADAADLVCELSKSPYFRQVNPSFYRGTKIQRTPAGAVQSPGNAGGAKTAVSLDVTAFEITCYLANYREGGQ
jgi:hypothetical protein